VAGAETPSALCSDRFPELAQRVKVAKKQLRAMARDLPNVITCRKPIDTYFQIYDEITEQFIPQVSHNGEAGLDAVSLKIHLLSCGSC
jgi:hypothetical protein